MKSIILLIISIVVLAAVSPMPRVVAAPSTSWMP